MTIFLRLPPPHTHRILASQLILNTGFCILGMNSLWVFWRQTEEVSDPNWAQNWLQLNPKQDQNRIKSNPNLFPFSNVCWSNQLRPLCCKPFKYQNAFLLVVMIPHPFANCFLLNHVCPLWFYGLIHFHCGLFWMSDYSSCNTLFSKRDLWKADTMQNWYQLVNTTQSSIYGIWVWSLWKLIADRPHSRLIVKAPWLQRAIENNFQPQGCQKDH